MKSCYKKDRRSRVLTETRSDIQSQIKENEEINHYEENDDHEIVRRFSFIYLDKANEATD